MHVRQSGQPAAICVLTALVLAGAGAALSGCGSRGPSRTGHPPVTQATFEALIIQDRAELMAGRLSYTAPQAIAVSTTRAVTVTLEAADHLKPVPPGQTQPHVTLKVGGLEGATLTATNGSIAITRVGPATGLIAQPGDEVSWTWDLTPQEPGPVVLDLVVVTYLGDTSEPLYTLSPPLVIRLTAGNTIGHQTTAVGSDITAIAAVVGSVAGALVALAGCMAWVVRSRDRRRKRHQKDVAPAPGETTAAEQTGDGEPFARPG